MNASSTRLAALLALLSPSLASAYDFMGGKWARGEIAVDYYVANSLSTDVPDRGCLEAIQMGYTAWHQPCSYMQWEYKGRTPNDAWGASDGQNISSWREEDWDQPPEVLGITSTITNFNGELEDADIKFNGRDHSWAHFADAPDFASQVDIASVSAHEAGHALGLGHTDVEGSTMWPTTGPGDITNRSLGADDIQGVCEIYPNGGEIPDPGEEPPPLTGDLGFGEDCSAALCAEGLFCTSDGRDQYCSRTCDPLGNDCELGYYCAPLAGGGGACARGADPGSSLGNFGEECGQARGCTPGFTCVNDSNTFYCTGPCLNGTCPEGFFCAEVQGGGNVCARGEAGGGGPALGEPCDARGLCQRGLFCLNDETHVDDATGQPVPYCTMSCDEKECPADFRCLHVPPLGHACQLIPSAGVREVGEECWVNPEFPENDPSCGDTLVCVGAVSDQGVWVNKGTCTKNCSPTECCPEGWGCAELTPVVGQCLQGRPDDEGFECTDGAGGTSGEGGSGGGGTGEGGSPTEIDAGLSAGGAGGSGPGATGGGSSGGCQAFGGRGVPGTLPFVLAGAVAFLSAARRRRRR